MRVEALKRWQWAIMGLLLGVALSFWQGSTGVERAMVDRSTLSNWVGTACWWLAPPYELVVATLLSSVKIFADDTSLPVLDPGRGRTKTGYLWCYAVDDRPWCGPSNRAVAYIYTEDRKNARPAEHLALYQFYIGWVPDLGPRVAASGGSSCTLHRWMSP